MSFDSTDFGDLADHVRTQSADAPGSDTERVTIRSLESLDTDALADLLEMAETEHDRPADLVFVLPQPPADLAADASPGGARGRPRSNGTGGLVGRDSDA